MGGRIPAAAGGRRREWIVGQLSLILFALALIWPVVAHPGWWLWKPGSPHSDLAVTHWPNAHYVRRMLWDRGQFPIWRSTIMSGVPFAANPLAGLYYPLNWLFLFLPWLPLEVGFNVSAAIHLWLAGAAMYALMRHGFRAGLWPATVAAVAYQGSPKLLAHLGIGHVGWTQAWAWLPLVVLCTLKASQSERGQANKWAVGAGAALAVQFCADVRMAAYTLMAVLTLIAVRLLGRVGGRGEEAGPGSRPAVRDVGLMIGGLSAFLGLSACQWLPTLALLPDTTRSSLTVADAAVWSLPGRYLVGILLADYGGFPEWVTYAGVATLVFASAAVWSSCQGREQWTAPDPGSVQRWIPRWLVGLAIFAAWLSLGENGGLFQILWRVVPGLGLLRVPPRAWVLVAFATSALAGLGIEAIESLRSTGRGRVGRWSRALLLGVGALPPALLGGYWLALGKPPLNLAMLGVVAPLAVGLCGRRHPRLGRGLVGAVAALLVAIDLWVVDLTLVEARPPGAVFSGGQAAADWLATQPAGFRIYSPSYSIPQHVAEEHSLELADGVDPLQLRAYADYLTLAAGLKPQQEYSVTLPPFPEGSDVRTALRDLCPDPDMLGRLGVRYAAAAFPLDCAGQAAGRSWQSVGRFDDTYVYQNLEARPAPSTESAMSVTLSDGTELFRYNPWPVYVGWGVSVATLGCVAVWAVGRSRSRLANG